VWLILVGDNNTLLLRILNKHATNIGDLRLEVTSLCHEAFQRFLEAWGKDGNSPIKPLEETPVGLAYHAFFAVAATEVTKKKKRLTTIKDGKHGK
jgi:hypothetical protein